MKITMVAILIILVFPMVAYARYPTLLVDGSNFPIPQVWDGYGWLPDSGAVTTVISITDTVPMYGVSLKYIYDGAGWLPDSNAVSIVEDTIGVTAQIVNQVSVTIPDTIGTATEIVNRPLVTTDYNDSMTTYGLDYSSPTDYYPFACNDEGAGRTYIYGAYSMATGLATDVTTNDSLTEAITAIDNIGQDTPVLTTEYVNTVDTFGAVAFAASTASVTLDQSYREVRCSSDTDCVVKIGGIPVDIYEGSFLAAGNFLYIKHTATVWGARTLSDLAAAPAAFRVQGVR